MLNKLDPLEKLENWIVEKFSRIQNKNINPLISKEAPLRKGIELSVSKIINIIIIFIKISKKVISFIIYYKKTNFYKNN